MGYPAQNCYVPWVDSFQRWANVNPLLEDVLNRATKIAHSIIRKIPFTWKEKAHMVGLGAVIFGDLINDRVKDIEFDWDKVLDFSGETAPYIQYAHARICSIFRKAESEGENILFPLKDDFPILTEIGFLDSMEEEQLLITLSRFQEQIGRAAQDCRPSYLARYLVDLARVSTDFIITAPCLQLNKN